MADRTPTAAPSRRFLAAAAAVVCVGAATGFWVMKHRAPGDPETVASGATVAAAPNLGGVPLFSTWPKEKPELALVITGQTFGYLSPCGCSRPQKGGLERRSNLIDQLKAKGWPVVGLDLGDITATKGPAPTKQNLLKYQTAMRTLGAIGYAAVGLGEDDFHPPGLYTLLGEYALKYPDQSPRILAANLLSVTLAPNGDVAQVFPRPVAFPGAGKSGRPMVEAVEVVTGPHYPAVGVVGVIGPEVGEQIKKQDRSFSYAEVNQALKAAVAELDAHPAKPELRVLLYAGSQDRAKAVAAAFPQFQLVVCQSEEAEPSQFPAAANNGKTMIVQVGQKGQNVGVVGAFKGKTGPELKYQLVPLGEEYLTPEGDKAAAANPALVLLEEYAREVKKQNLIGAARAKPLPHSAQLKHPGEKLTYVGAQKCATCHAAEYAVWSQSKHSHAYEALEKATRPDLRQFDPECVVCHTTGFQYAGGFENETASAFLKGNQCENCHGPGSAHAAQPTNKAFYPDLLAWRQAAPAGAKLPDKAVIEDMAKKKPLERGGVVLPAGQQQMVNAVSGMCTKCHDELNDPNFDFYTYFPKIYHSGLKATGLPADAK